MEIKKGEIKGNSTWIEYQTKDIIRKITTNTQVCCEIKKKIHIIEELCIEKKNRN